MGTISGEKNTLAGWTVYDISVVADGVFEVERLDAETAYHLCGVRMNRKHVLCLLCEVWVAEYIDASEVEPFGCLWVKVVLVSSSVAD